MRANRLDKIPDLQKVTEIGGTTDQPIVINNDLTVTGTTTLVSATTSGQVIIDIDHAEALLIRKDGDAGDIFTVDTALSNVLVDARLKMGTSQPLWPAVGKAAGLQFLGTAATRAGIIYDTDEGMSFVAGDSDGNGNHVINIISGGNVLKDHDHDTFQTNPTEHIHDATDPDVSNNLYGTRYHDGTNYVFSAGANVGTGSAPVTANNGISLEPLSLTSGGTNDFALQIKRTLNDTGAAGGSDLFNGLLMDITETDKTGWDIVNLVDLQVGGVSQFKVDDSGTTTIGGDVLIENGNGLIIGGTSQITSSAIGELQLLGTGGPDSTFIMGRFSSDASKSNIDFVKSRNGTIGSNTIVNDNDGVGGIRWLPDDGVDFATLAAQFSAEVDDASPAAGDIGMAFVWEQMPGAGGAVRETMRISAAGNLSLSAGLILTNKGTDLASANDMSAPDSNYCDVTGTTQINTMAIGPISAGTPIMLQFDGSVTVKHATAGTGAQFALASSADFAATAGDTLVVAYDGTVWREMSRTAI